MEEGDYSGIGEHAAGGVPDSGDAGMVFLFHRGRRLDDVAITITGGETGPADVQEETAAAGRRRIFLAANPSRNEDSGREGRRARAGKDKVGGRQLSAVPEETVSTPLPEATSFDHGVGLLSLSLIHI